MSVTAAQGFRASGATAGLKASGGSDVALVVNDGPDHTAAAVFTSIRVQAAPVTWSRQLVSDGRADAVFLHSGGANACTGPRGFQDTHRTAELVAQALGCSAMDVVVCSTGLIGEFLPMDRIESGVGLTVGGLTSTAGGDAARAIMTTDSVPKEAVTSRDGWTVGGMAKGAGMLAPGLATMLCVITTDVVADADTLDTALRAATTQTFDRVDSDGCMSTNDTVVLLASGASGVAPAVGDLVAAVTEVCSSLARQLVADAEGASHDIAVEVRSAATEQEAVEVARSVTRSNLFKAAIFGKDPNWGRVLAAVGTTSASFDPSTLDVAINGVQVCRASSVGDDRDLVDLEPREVRVVVDLHAGAATATVWTNDLTHEYVHENSAYST